MFESRISAGATEKLPEWKKRSMVLRHGQTCSELRKDSASRNRPGFRVTPVQAVRVDSRARPAVAGPARRPTVDGFVFFFEWFPDFHRIEHAPATRQLLVSERKRQMKRDGSEVLGLPRPPTAVHGQMSRSARAGTASFSSRHSCCRGSALSSKPDLPSLIAARRCQRRRFRDPRPRSKL